MKDVIDFPKNTDFDTTFIDKSIKDLLDHTTTDQKAKSELTERLLSIYEFYQKEFSFDFSIECPPSIARSEAAIIEESARENFGRLMKTIHDKMDAIILDRFQAEIKLFFLENSGDPLTQ